MTKHCCFNVSGVDISIDTENIKSISVKIIDGVLNVKIDERIDEQKPKPVRVDTPSRPAETDQPGVDLIAPEGNSRAGFSDGFPFEITDLRHYGSKKKRQDIFPPLSKEETLIKRIPSDFPNIYNGFAKTKPRDCKYYQVTYQRVDPSETR
jgi:hypothetical protein